MKTLWAEFILVFKMVYWCAILIFRLIKAIVALVIFFMKWQKKKKSTHGDADFLNAKQLKELGHYKTLGWLMGIKDGKRVYSLPEACVIGMAPRRTGKAGEAARPVMG